MSKEEVKFTLNPVDEIPERTYQKRSKYDQILTAFQESGNPMSEVTMGKLKPDYLRTQLNKRLEANKLTEEYVVTVINSVCYIMTAEAHSKEEESEGD